MSTPYYYKSGPSIGKSERAITSEHGDELFDRAMRERRFEDWPVKPLGRVMARPEPIAAPGAGSSLTGIGGGSLGMRHGSGYSKRGIQG